MTYGELKNTNIYKKADDIYLHVNGEEAIDEMYYPDELDHLPVVGTGLIDNELHIDIVCSNWGDRYKVGWVAE